tara:strand:+ start:81 stop:488 length:408 start_codon:yes stop_codon:yes gene_type:complete
MNKELTNDVSQFINKFEKKIADLDAKKILEYGSDRWSRLPVILEALKIISEGDGTLKGFSVGDTNDYGCVQNSRFVVKAYSKEHACLKAAILSGNMEWYTTGFYAAEQVDLDELIKSTKIVIKSETEKLSKLLNL